MAGTQYLDAVLSLVWKILALVEGVLDNWANGIAFGSDPTAIGGGGLTTEGIQFTAEISDIVEKVIQICEYLIFRVSGFSEY